MDCEIHEDEFYKFLSELDNSKALMRESQGDLNRLLSAGTHADSPQGYSHQFDIVSLRLNESAVRYRRAVKSFNAACRIDITTLERSRILSEHR